MTGQGMVTAGVKVRVVVEGVAVDTFMIAALQNKKTVRTFPRTGSSTGVLSH